mgnify:CR=1 FL=1
MTDLAYFISSPYIDAYVHDCELSSPKIDYDSFVAKMISQAYEWGEQSVGRSVLNNEVPAKNGDDYVLAFGTHGGKRYVAVDRRDGLGNHTIQVIEL